MDTLKPAKGLVESPLFKKSKDKITQDTRLLDDILEGLTLTIACKPDEFPLVDDLGTRTAKSKVVNDIPELTLYFKEYEEQIVLVDIEITPDEIPF